MSHPLSSPRAFACSLALSFILAASAASAEKLAVNARGAALAKLLDSMDVESRWLKASPGNEFLVNWQTGLSKGNEGAQPNCRKKSMRSKKTTTFCSSFVSAVVWKVGRKLLGREIPFPHPFNRDTETFGAHGQCAPRDFLSNKLQDWLAGREISFPKKWKATPPKMEGFLPVEPKDGLSLLAHAQKIANHGHLVIASYAYRGNGKPKPGHITVVRPTEKSLAKIEKEGPQMVNAGWKNYASVSFRTAFAHHSCEGGQHEAYCGEAEDGTPKGAWESMTSKNPKVRFFYHLIRK